jgi:hypothetical protein
MLGKIQAQLYGFTHIDQGLEDGAYQTWRPSHFFLQCDVWGCKSFHPRFSPFHKNLGNPIDYELVS